MSNTPENLAQQIAALEAALHLPLPDEARRQLSEQLRVLRAQSSADHGAIHGTVDISGTLHGNAIGVNLGTVQTFSGAQPVAPGPAASAVSQEEIDYQRELLAARQPPHA